MRIQAMVDQWEANNRGEKTQRTFTIKLPLKQAAQLMALREMYPDCSEEQMLTDLIGAALDELKEALPYEAGTVKIAEDEYGDPIFADNGLTPKFISLTRKYSQSLRQENEAI